MAVIQHAVAPTAAPPLITGLRGEPVANIAALQALNAKDAEARRVNGLWYEFVLGATTGTFPDTAATGYWKLANTIGNGTNTIEVLYDTYKPPTPFGLNSAHQTINLGFNIFECSELRVYLSDDSDSEWGYGGMINVDQFKNLNTYKYLVNRIAGQFVWARWKHPNGTVYANPYNGEISMNDNGGVGARIYSIEGWKKVQI